MIGSARALAREVGGEGITVDAVTPGAIQDITGQTLDIDRGWALH